MALIASPDDDPSAPSLASGAANPPGGFASTSMASVLTLNTSSGPSADEDLWCPEVEEEGGLEEEPLLRSVEGLLLLPPPLPPGLLLSELKVL